MRRLKEQRFSSAIFSTGSVLLFFVWHSGRASYTIERNNMKRLGWCGMAAQNKSGKREVDTGRGRLGVWGRRVVTCVLVGTALVSAGKLISYVLESRQAEGRFDDLARQVRTIADAPAERDTPEKTPEQGAVPLTALEQLHLQNGDLVGWITVPGTRIDYPVMHTPERPEQYLRRDFDGNYSLSGTPFLDGRCTLDSGNLIVWGHNMKSGTMFADLLQYKDPDYAKKHALLVFSTLRESHSYEVVAAFRSEVNRDGDYFRWFNHLDFADQKAFDAFADGLRALSLIPVPEDLSFGDTFLTLATCSYHDQNGRFVLVGRQVEQAQSERPVTQGAGTIEN